MRKVLAIILGISLLFASGCSEKQQEKPVINSAQQTKTETKTAANEQPKKSEENRPLDLPKEPKQIYQQSQAHSKQKVIAAFTIGSDIGIKDGKEFKLEGPLLLLKDHHFDSSREVYIPLNDFISIIDIPDTGVKWEKTKENRYSIDLQKGNTIAHSDGWGLSVNGVQIYPGSSLDITHVKNTTKYITLAHLARAFGYDVYWNKNTGRVEILEQMPMKEADFFIGSLSIGMTTKQIVSIQGSPNKIDGPKYAPEQQNVKMIILQYPGLMIVAHGKQGSDYWEWPASELLSTEATYQTPVGIKVGDRIEKVIETYGMGYDFSDKFNVYAYRPFTNYENRKNIEFFVRDGIVTKIYIGHW